jgi:hypothetical protein
MMLYAKYVNSLSIRDNCLSRQIEKLFFLFLTIKNIQSAWRYGIRFYLPDRINCSCYDAFYVTSNNLEYYITIVTIWGIDWQDAPLCMINKTETNWQKHQILFCIRHDQRQSFKILFSINVIVLALRVRVYRQTSKSNKYTELKK